MITESDKSYYERNWTGKQQYYDDVDSADKTERVILGVGLAIGFIIIFSVFIVSAIQLLVK